MAFLMGVTCFRTRLGKCWIGLQNLHQNNQLTHKHVNHRAMIAESHIFLPGVSFLMSRYTRFVFYVKIHGHEMLAPLKR